MNDATPPQSLPRLRQELILSKGPVDHFGWPTYTLHDPVRHRFFRLGWREFEMLSRWEVGTDQALIERIHLETTIVISTETVKELVAFFRMNNLILPETDADLSLLHTMASRRRLKWMTWFLHHYLFVRIPLVRPDRFLSRALPFVDFFYKKFFLFLTIFIALAGIYLVSRQIEMFRETFIYLFNFHGMLLYGVTLSGVKIAHELGHAFTLRRYGQSVPTMGVALLVMWPVLYTEASAAWLLSSRRQRMAVGGGGVAAELIIAAFALLAWGVLPEGPARTTAFLLATASLAGTLIININPFMRFDGYYLLSDWLGMDNLQDRAFALARWRMRNHLLGLDSPKPEQLPRGLESGLILYAYATWVYRFVLFLGIALVVYHFFFKLLGILLFGVEIGWFIVRPIWNELKVWLSSRASWSGQSKRTAVLLACLLVMLMVFPWRQSVTAPATLRATEKFRVFPPYPSRLVESLVREGEFVKADQTLFIFDSADLNYRLEQAKLSIKIITWQLGQQTTSRMILRSKGVLESELKMAQSEYATADELIQKKMVTSPMDGRIVDLSYQLTKGRWIDQGEPLATIISPRSRVVEAYVGETDAELIHNMSSSSFIPEDPDLPVSTVSLLSLARSGSATLREPYLASIYGGDIAVHQDARTEEMIPHVAVFRTTFALISSSNQYPGMVLRGQIRIKAQPVPLIVSLLRSSVSVILREIGF
ncbi:MAG: HlyD family efflux transporter periplasmic adaptor subunit [Magnetococcales bacterium]|nr:HlyD family efflux transporter periplasmic adaptor subunit [Magnetococcales bacterium]